MWAPTNTSIHIAQRAASPLSPRPIPAAQRGLPAQAAAERSDLQRLSAAACHNSSSPPVSRETVPIFCTCVHQAPSSRSHEACRSLGLPTVRPEAAPPARAVSSTLQVPLSAIPVSAVSNATVGTSSHKLNACLWKSRYGRPRQPTASLCAWQAAPTTSTSASGPAGPEESK